jgi:methyl-accepting chemotaxis protein
MDTFLQRLGLSQQIAFVGMLGVIGLIVVGGIYGLGNARQMTAQQRVDRAKESIDALDGIKIGGKTSMPTSRTRRSPQPAKT